MLYTKLTIRNKDYNLRLTTRNSVALERSLGYNPISMLMDIEKGKMPKLEDVIKILHACLLQDNHGLTLEKTYDLFDDYASEGNSMFDLIPVFVEVFQNCGYITKSEDAAEGEIDEKN